MPLLRNTREMLGALCLSAGVAFPTDAASAQDSDLAQKLSNPVSAMISVPLQGNYDGGIGPEDDGEKFLVNIQPVIPLSLNDDWNVISRTILPIVSQSDIFPGSGGQFGLGDTLQSFFLTPKAAKPGGIIWGVGPVLLLPTATDTLLGGGKWAAGPTGVALKQAGPWTVGLLANHLFSFAGSDSRGNISSTFLQPFLSYTTKTSWTFGINSETSHDWIGNQWSVPVNVTTSKLLTLGGQPISIGGGVRYWVSSPDYGPSGFGARLSVTLLFPVG